MPDSNRGTSVHLSDFTAVSPSSLREVLELLASNENAVPLAGGTDLMVELDACKLSPCTFVNLQAVSELNREMTIGRAGELRFGALTTFRETRLEPRVAELYPMLAKAAREVGAPAVQSVATWAGNVVNSSPAADGVPALMVYDAELELTSLSGRRRVALHDFYTGYKQNILKLGEIITEICLPPMGAGWQEYYRKVGTRRFQAISKTLLAARVLMNGERVFKDVRLALASVAPFTLRAVKTEGLIRGETLCHELIKEATDTLEREIQPIDDLRSSVAYRRQVSGNLLREFFSGLLPERRSN